MSMTTTQTKTTTRTKAQLAEQVAQLEQRLAAVKQHRDEIEVQLIELRSANAESAQVADAFLAFVAAMPRKTVYRALARHLHPDVGGDTAAMQDLAAAWAATEGR